MIIREIKVNSLMEMKIKYENMVDLKCKSVSQSVSRRQTLNNQGAKNSFHIIYVKQ